MQDLLSDLSAQRTREPIGEGAVVLRGFACVHGGALLRAVEAIGAAAPFRHLTTPGGHVMSVAMTNCGALGWVSDRSGYRYQCVDPVSGPPAAWLYERASRKLTQLYVTRPELAEARLFTRSPSD